MKYHKKKQFGVITYINDDGKLHREDGPAYIAPMDGWGTIDIQYWIEGTRVTEEEFNKYQLKKKLEEMIYD